LDNIYANEIWQLCYNKYNKIQDNKRIDKVKGGRVFCASVTWIALTLKWDAKCVRINQQQ